MVHILSREEVKRISRSGGNSAGSGGSEFDESTLAGLATEAWCKDNFVTVGFFDSIFQAYNDEDKISVNGEIPVDASKMNIKAMFGFWTDFYISALGNGGVEGAGTYLASLADVSVAGVQSGQVLTWDSSENKWVADNPQTGVDMTTVWTNLAAGGNQQINASHLSTALGTYATQAWVTQNFLGANATAAAANKLATPRTLWGQSFDGTANVSGDMSSVGNISFQASGKNIGGVLYFDTGNARIGVGVSSPSHKLHVDGGIYSTSYVTALSDIRMKHVVARFHLKPEAIASASIIRYRWKDGHDNMIHTGGIAQEWQEILPDAVISDEDGHLSMDYSAIAYTSAVSLARVVVEQQNRIGMLEKRLARLEAMFAINNEEEE